MKLELLPTEIILSHSCQILGKVRLDWNPQPGAYLDLEGETYAVLERHHRYQYKSGKYHLQKIALYVQSAQRPAELNLLDGHWVVGDTSCFYNAHSELVRCAVNPYGPCRGCQFFKAIDSSGQFHST